MPPLYAPPPSEQIFKSFLPGKYIGFSISKYFASRFTYLSEQDWIELILKGKIKVNEVVVSPDYILRQHDFIYSNLGLCQEPPVNRNLEVLFEDANVRVFNKVAPIPVHPSGRFFKNSMTELLKKKYPAEIPRPVQRLDVATTGVLVFARTRKAAAFLMDEFSGQRVYKEYLAVVEGTPKKRCFTVDEPIGRITKTRWGVGSKTQSAKPAITDFEWLYSWEGLSLLKVVPRSGRTNQIRVHLKSLGLPIWNDPVYGRGENDPAVEMGLHARRLRFNCLDQSHDIEAPWPRHFRSLMELNWG